MKRCLKSRERTFKAAKKRLAPMVRRKRWRKRRGTTISFGVHETKIKRREEVTKRSMTTPRVAERGRKILGK